MEPVAKWNKFRNISCGRGSAGEMPAVTNKDLLPQALFDAKRLLFI